MAGRNGLPEPKPYVYRGNGSGLSDAEAASALATSREARAAVPVPAAATPEIKGAVKVAEWPSKYPFAAIARDGGIWRLDPAVFGISVAGLKMAASKWATRQGLTAVTADDEGYVYLQFGGDADAARHRAELAEATSPRRRA